MYKFIILACNARPPELYIIVIFRSIIFELLLWIYSHSVISLEGVVLYILVSIYFMQQIANLHCIVMVIRHA